MLFCILRDYVDDEARDDTFSKCWVSNCRNKVILYHNCVNQGFNNPLSRKQKLVRKHN